MAQRDDILRAIEETMRTYAQQNDQRKLTATQVMLQHQAAINAKHAYLIGQLGVPHGRHRQAPQTLHGSPAGVPGSGSGGGASGPAASALTVRAPEPSPPAIEEAGIRAGEIIAWRVWKLKPVVENQQRFYNLAQDRYEVETVCGTPLLRSTYKNTVWEPGQTMEAHADPTTQKYDPESHSKAEFVGIFAWKTLGQLCQYVQRQFVVRDNDPRRMVAMQMTMNQSTILVTGQIALWGSVIEHEHGYRAQFARPHRLFMVSNANGEQVNEPLRVELCRLYGLPEEGV